MKTATLRLLLLTFFSPLHAEEPAAPAAAPVSSAASPAEQAAALLREGRAQAAYDLLLPRHAADKGDTETAFLLGQAAQQLNRPEEAARLYEGILGKNKNLPRVRLELARAYAALGETKKAKDQFLAVLSDSPPPLVGENIGKYMASMEARKNWNVRVNAGYLYDSNVNAGPTARTVLMFGAPFRLSDDSREKSAQGYTAGVDAGHLLELTPALALQSDAGYSRARYFGLHGFDSDSFSVSAGPTLRGKGFILSAPALFENVRIGHARYNYAYGLAPQVMVPFSERLTASASLVLQKKYYFVGGGLRNGPVWSVSAGAKYYYRRDAFVQASFRHAAEGTRADYLDNASNGLNLGWYSSLPWGLSLYAGPGISYTRYAEKEAAYDERRKDAQYSAVLNLSRDFPAAGLSATAGCTLTRNDSNLGLYDYVRRQLSAGLSMAF